MKMPWIKLVESDDAEAWKAARNRYITASDVPAILGESEFKGPRTVFMEKKGAIAPFAGNARTRLGLMAEPHTIAQYQEHSGRIVKPNHALCQSRKWPWLAATFDALHTGKMVDGSEDKAWHGAPLEVKLTSSRNGGKWNGGIPAYYRGQILAQMIVAGRDRGAMGVFFDDADDDPYRFLDLLGVEQSEIDRILAVLSEFNLRLELNDPPPLGAGDMTDDNLKRLRPVTATVEVFDLGADFAGPLAELAAAKEAEAEASARKREIEGRIKGAMVEHGAHVATAPDGSTWTWREQTRKGTCCPKCGEQITKDSTFPVLRRGK